MRNRTRSFLAWEPQRSASGSARLSPSSSLATRKRPSGSQEHWDKREASPRSKGLIELSKIKDDRVRVAILRTAACIGLRSDALAQLARKCMDSVDQTTRRTGLLVLGRIGDGQDAPALPALAETAPTTRTRWAAEAALRLADFADEVEATRRFDLSGETHEETRAALTAPGLSVD